MGSKLLEVREIMLCDCAKAIFRLQALLILTALTLTSGGFLAQAGEEPKKEESAAAPAEKTEAADDGVKPAAYPTDICVVMDDTKLGEEGEKPQVINYKGREVQLCCKQCVKDFNAEPEKYIKALDQAVIKAQKEKYPLDVCVVSNQKI